MYEWESDYLQVPVPPVVSRDRGADGRGADNAEVAHGRYYQEGAAVTAVPENYSTQPEAHPPSLLGAFSNLIQRIVPGEGGAQPTGSYSKESSRGPSRASSKDAATARSSRDLIVFRDDFGHGQVDQREVGYAVAPTGSFPNSRDHSELASPYESNFSMSVANSPNAQTLRHEPYEGYDTVQWAAPPSEETGALTSLAANLGLGRLFFKDDEIPNHPPTNAPEVSAPPLPPPAGSYRENEYDEDDRDEEEACVVRGASVTPETAVPRENSKQRINSSERLPKETSKERIRRSLLMVKRSALSKKNILSQPFRACAASYIYCCPARCPCCAALVYLVIFGAITGIGMVVKPVDVETDFDSFMKTDVNSSTMRDSFLAALKFKTSDSPTSSSRRLSLHRDRRLSAMLFMQIDLTIVYELKASSSASSIFDPDVLSEVQTFEQHLKNMPQWVKTCEKALSPKDRQKCMPGISLINYALPTLTVPSGSIIPVEMIFNGTGRDPVPVDTTLRILKSHGVSLNPGAPSAKLGLLILPKSQQLQANADVAALVGIKLFRTVFRFRWYCCRNTDPKAKQTATHREMKSEWKTFVEDHLLPELQKAGDESRDDNKHLRIYYAGQDIEDIEVMDALWGDVKLAFCSMVFVLCYLIFHTRSFFLGFMGLLTVVLSVPFSYVTFAVLADTEKTSIASFLSLFLVVGLGSDVVFVYTDFWRDALRDDDLSTEAEKMVWTLQMAGKASLATSGTTAISFFANLVSVLRPLREFGMFMGLCVVFVWVLITLIYLPLMAVDSRYFSRCAVRSLGQCGQSHSERKGFTSRFFGSCSRIVWRWRIVILLLALILGVSAIVCAILNVETDTGVPNIFPKDHNQNAGKEAMDKFGPVGELLDPRDHIMPPINQSICKEHQFRTTDPTHCSLFWCEVLASEAVSPAGVCKCWRKEKACGTFSGNPTASIRFVGASSITTNQLNTEVTNHVMQTPGISPVYKTSQAMAPVLLQEWESGNTMLKPMAQADITFFQQPSSTSCGFSDLCYCGTYVCQPHGFVKTSDISLALGGRRLQEHQRNASAAALQVPAPDGRRMQQYTVLPSQQASVDVVWGIQGIEHSRMLGETELKDMWKFSPHFDLKQPWAQRNMLTFCKNLPTNLRVVKQWCIIEEFQQFVLNHGTGRFPVLQGDFNNEMARFFITGLTHLTPSKEFCWVRGAEIKAVYARFVVDVNKNGQVEPSLEYKKLWDSHVVSWNADASRYTRGAWHTSALWVRAQAAEELFFSTAVTLILVITLAFMGMLVFTLNLILSFYVVFSTLLVLGSLAFFITTIMGWAIGPIEVIALIIFLGYAVTYSLHIAHKYGGNESLKLRAPDFIESPTKAIRYQRTHYALKSIGGAALGSSITTIGCALFLVFCTLTIFQKLGGVVLAVTMMSILTALAPLPAALMTAGPLKFCSRGSPEYAGSQDDSLENFTDGNFASVGSCLYHLGGPCCAEALTPCTFCCFFCIRAASNRYRQAVVGEASSIAGTENSPRSAASEAAAPASPIIVSMQDHGALSSAVPVSLDGGTIRQPQAAAPAFMTPALVAGTSSGRQNVEVEEVRLSEKGFDIGEESPLEPIWARDSRPTNNARGPGNVPSPSSHSQAPLAGEPVVVAGQQIMAGKPMNVAGVRTRPRAKE